jgi:energy-coupling factor transporter ATP-binding protein EcfA2
LSAILTGPILAVLWHQRGLLPLHASVVVINGRAVALCGPAAAGKSTLAAVLAAQGHQVVADDIGIVDVRSNQEVLVPPGCARLQLWRDALAELDVATDGLKRALPDKERYFFDCGSGMLPGPHKLAAVVQMVRHTLPPAALERLRGSQTADVLYNCVHSPRPAKALGRTQAIFATRIRMTSAGVGVWRLKVPEGLAGLRQAAAQLAAALEG